MAKIGALLEKLFKKAGVDTTQDALLPLFALDADISDEVNSKVDKSLLTLDAAKNNTEVIKAIRATTLSGADSKIDEVITELGLTVDDHFANNKNTFEKIGLLTKIAHDAGKKASGSHSKQSADDFAIKEADYQKQLKTLSDTLKAKESEFTTTRENDLTTFDLKMLLAGKNYIFPEGMDTNLKLQTALGAVQNELNKKGFSIKRNEAGQLIVVNKDGQPAYNDTFEAIEPNTFIDGALAQNQLLRINDVNQQQPTGTQQTIPTNGNPANATVLAEIESQLAAMK